VGLAVEERAVSVLAKARPEPPRDEGVDKGRTWIARGFTRVEDVVYVALGLLLAGSALALLVIRRTLVLTAEFSELLDQGDEAFRNAMLELGLLTALIVGLVVSLALLRQRADRAVAGRAH
jgi:hypothetical protein